ncbi:hypothetical protein [Teredinibacter sp. KSP-S5-2]|uniref:hypothetical protein n=1 Tax=Teredinibacter sp. KSP-S5-2 TaxID=3034506 RepID=UPI0029343112|nr:hypothetical protein [Teredinibacter sp. KSP-S5-2]WNO10292.1 hypothetical protein P5V12_03810 [Teredinibacter sp. KSP-S5-2]
MAVIASSQNGYSSEEVDSSPYVVDAVVVNDKSVELEFKLKNNSKDKLIFYSDLLSRDNVVLYISKSTAYGGILEELGAIDDPDVGRIEIKSGESYSSKLNLERIFPSIRKELAKKELLLFWSTEVKTVDGKFSNRFGGYLSLNKNK